MQDTYDTARTALEALSPDEQATCIAQVMNWAGDGIFAVMHAALTDANFHREAAALQTVWEGMRDEA